MGNAQVEKAINLFRLWLDGLLRQMRDYLDLKYPPEKPVLVKPDKNMMEALKQQLKVDLLDEIKADILEDLKADLQLLVNKTEIQADVEILEHNDSEFLIDQTTKTQIENNDEVAEESSKENHPSHPEVDLDIPEQVVEEKSISKPKSQSQSLYEALHGLSIVKKLDSLRDHLSDDISDEEVASLFIRQVKHNHAPKLYRNLDYIISIESGDSIKLHIPTIGDTYQPLYDELVNSRKGTPANKNTIIKLVRPGIVVNGEVVSKALVDVLI